VQTRSDEMRHSTPAFLIVARRECARHTQEGLFRVNQLEEITPCAETDSPDCRGKEKLIRAEPPRPRKEQPKENHYVKNFRQV
jgi:hypothetical protein